MKPSKFSDEQIIAILKEVELGAKVTAVCRRHGFYEATYYNWKTHYAGMDVCQMRRPL
jgi:putative transposase